MSNIANPLLYSTTNPQLNINPPDDDISDAGTYESGVSDEEFSDEEIADIMDPETPPGPPPNVDNDNNYILLDPQTPSIGTNSLDDSVDTLNISDLDIPSDYSGYTSEDTWNGGAKKKKTATKKKKTTTKKKKTATKKKKTTTKKKKTTTKKKKTTTKKKKTTTKKKKTATKKKK